MTHKNRILSKANGDTRPKSSNKDLDKILKKVWDQDARMKVMGNRIMIYPVDTAQDGVLVHHTASDHRAAANTAARLKDRGFNL